MCLFLFNGHWMGNLSNAVLTAAVHEGNRSQKWALSFKAVSFIGSLVSPTWIRFFGVFFALASDDEDENEQKDEDKAHQSDHNQEPPLFIEWRHFLG